MWKPLLLGIAVALAGTSVRADDQLSVGDPAPKIEVKEFVKGDAVAKFDKGKIYVVEFWATWCGPCRVSIPHLTDLQKQYKDVTFIGVSVWEQKPEDVKPFVEKMGDKMDYRVALDLVGAGAKDNKGAMAQTWMEAAGQKGIPAAFIINGDGKIAWIGHPMQMDKALEQVVAGKWDVAAAAVQYKKEKARELKLRDVYARLRKAQEAGSSKEALEVLNKAFKEDPDIEDSLGRVKFQLLAGKDGDPDKALAYGKQLLEKVKDNANELNEMAWAIVDPEAPKADAKLLKFALEVAQRADEVAKGKNPYVADTLAKAYFDNGEVAKALTTQERALELAKGTPLEKDPSLTQRLEQYKKAPK